MLKKLFVFALLMLLTSCTGAQASPAGMENQSSKTTNPASNLIIAPSENTLAPTPTASYTPVIDEEISMTSICACSPIENISLEEITEIISNPFEMPKPGMDDGHHGVDFAFYRFGDLIGMDGLSVISLLPGTVAGTISDRPPYGNTVIIETPINHLPATFLSELNLPETSPTVEPFPALNCPELPNPPIWDFNQKSIYLLYAHMKNVPELMIENPVSCCQTLGEVGTSGNSVNNHLHFEVRIGPSGARFNAMAHYDNASTDEEMANYCTWRVSNTFQIYDPIQFINLLKSNQSS